MKRTFDRRDFLKLTGAAAALAASGCASMGGTKARVVVVGGGFGGATVAKYIRMWDPAIDVTMVERSESFISCPISNLVLGGFKQMADITRGYEGLQALGVKVLQGEVTAIDAAGRKVRNARFEKVWHNGVLVQEDVELFGPTRVGLPEAAAGPLRLQGDHGPVAYRNIRVRTLKAGR